MRIELLPLALAPLLIAAMPAQAQDERVAGAEIAAGAYGVAESKLLTELKIHPGRPELLLNLAAVYAKTGRATEAQALYTKVLAKEEVLMDLSVDRTAGSHALARTGLKRLSAVQFSAR